MYRYIGCVSANRSLDHVNDTLIIMHIIGYDRPAIWVSYQHWLTDTAEQCVSDWCANLQMYVSQ